MRFAWTAERAVEGEHAKFHKRGVSAPNHSVRYLSFVRRVAELRRHIERGPSLVFTLGKIMTDNSTSLKMLHALGLSRHHSMAALRAAVSDKFRVSRHKELYNFFFLGDSFSLHTLEPPPTLVEGQPQGRRLAAEASSEEENALLKKFAIEYLVQQFADHKEAIYSVPLRMGSLVKLCDLLQVQDFLYSDGDAYEVKGIKACTVDWGDLQVPAGYQEQVFFRAAGAGRALSLAKRRKLSGEQGLLASDIAISAHQVLDIDSSKDPNRIAVAMGSVTQWDSPEQQSLVLSLQALPFSTMKRVTEWETDGKVKYIISDKVLQEKMGSEGDLQAVKDMLNILFDVGRDGYRPGFLKGNQWTPAKEKNTLACLSSHGLAEEEGSRWHLTAAGQHLGVAAATLTKAGRGLDCRDVGLSEKTVFEMLVYLDTNGWEHCFATRASAEAYSIGGAKKFFTKRGALLVGKMYMMALATAHERPDKKVEHFKTERYYECLVKGKTFQRKTRRQPLDKRIFKEDEWLDEDVFEPAPRRQPKRRRPPQPGHQRRRQAGPASDEESDADKAGGNDSDSDSDTTSEKPGAAAADGDGGGSDSSESEAESSGSTSSTSSSLSSSSAGLRELVPAHRGAADAAPSGGGALGAGPAPAAPPSPAASAASTARGPRDLKAADVWGVFRLTPYRHPDGSIKAYQMTCKHPQHWPLCTKSRTARKEGAEVTRRRLKQWALLGLDKDSKQDHFDLWPAVEGIPEGDLPAEEALDALVPAE